MNVINFSDARSRLKSVLDQVVENADYTVITRRDAQDAVVMSLDPVSYTHLTLPTIYSV